MEWSVHKSQLDCSVNFVSPAEDGGMWEARFVQRDPSYAIVYLSSHSGCKHACRFCHLTQTGQTMFTPATLPILQAQFDQVFAYMGEVGYPAHININFMARGEALSNPFLMESFGTFADYVMDRVASLGLTVRFNISTIFPKDSVDVDLVRVFGAYPVSLFWSLYALDPGFRRRWLPRAQDPESVAARLQAWQAATGREVVFHWAFIEGENDTVEGVRNIRDWIGSKGLFGRFNLVRYNPHSDKVGREPDEVILEALFAEIVPAMKAEGSRMVPRVGFDVAASCGMFLSA